MKLKINFLLLLLASIFNNVSCENNADVSQMLKDIELAAQMGSGESVAIDLNATEGLEGKIAQTVRDAVEESPKPLTFFERVKAFFRSLFSW